MELGRSGWYFKVEVKFYVKATEIGHMHMQMSIAAGLVRRSSLLVFLLVVVFVSIESGIAKYRARLGSICDVAMEGKSGRENESVFEEDRGKLKLSSRFSLRSATLHVGAGRRFRWGRGEGFEERNKVAAV